MIVRSLTSLVMLIVAFSIAPQTLAAASLSAPIVEELLDKSGMNHQLADIEPSLEAQLNLEPTIGGGLPEARLERVRTAFRSAFGSESLNGSARALIAEAIPPEVASEVLLWLGSEPGRRITALEDAAGKLEGFEARAAAAEELFQRLPQRRVERYVRLAKATLAGVGSSTVAIDLTLATARGLAAIDGQVAEPRVAAIRAQLEKDRPAMEQSLEVRFVTLFAGAYESVEDKDLDLYIAFAESDAGQAYHRAMIKVLDGVMEQAGVEVGRLLAAKVPEPAKSGS